jgi:putative membrane protein
MPSPVRHMLPVLLLLAGLLLAGLVVWWADPGSVLDAVLRVGWGGFALLVGWQFLLFAVLALAWHVLAPGGYSVLLRARMVRDSATTCLPFSPLGGYVLGARAAGLAGLAWPLAAAGTVVDVAAEIVAQAVFTLAGVAALAARLPHSSLAIPLAIALALAGLAALAVRHRRRLAGWLGGLLDAIGGRIGADWLGAIRTELAALAPSPARFALGVSLHLLAWVMTGVGTWLAYRLLGAPVSLGDAIALEALLDAVVAVAFVVPAGAGVQEAGYAGLGVLFGIPPDDSLGVAVLRRARDVAVGAPILLAWQVAEWRAARRR